MMDYREGKNSFVRDDGRTYLVDDLIKASAKVKVTWVQMNRLFWMLSFACVCPKRASQVDIGIPILIRKHKSGYVVLDGMHRLYVHSLMGNKLIPCKIVNTKNYD